MGPLMWRMLKQSNWDSMEQIAPEPKISWRAILCWTLAASLWIWISFFPYLCLQKHQAALLGQVLVGSSSSADFKLQLTNPVANAFYFILFILFLTVALKGGLKPDQLDGEIFKRIFIKTKAEWQLDVAERVSYTVAARISAFCLLL